MLHRDTCVVLAIDQPGYCGNSTPGQDLGDEHNASSTVVARFASNVKAKVYFIEIRVKRNGEETEQPGASESKPN
jgi:hypothetical protein